MKPETLSSKNTTLCKAMLNYKKIKNSNKILPPKFNELRDMKSSYLIIFPLNFYFLIIISKKQLINFIWRTKTN